VTHKIAIRHVTLPIGLQNWTHTFANEPQECPLSAQQGLGVAFIALCFQDLTTQIILQNYASKSHSVQNYASYRER